VERTFNLTYPLGAVKESKIFVTGVKLVLYFQRLVSKSSHSLVTIPVHWRILCCGSSVSNPCGQEAGLIGFRMKGSFEGDMVSLVPSVGVEYGSQTGLAKACGSSILMKRFRMNGDAHCFKDTHGTLQDGHKSCHELEFWIPIKKWMSRENGTVGTWSYNLYFTLMLELSGVGNKYPMEEAFAGFSGSAIIYYK
jgi:hypothetical protein